MTPEIEASAQSTPLEIVQKGLLPNGKPRFGFSKVEHSSGAVSIRGFEVHGMVNRFDSLYRLDVSEEKLVDLYRQEIGMSDKQIGSIEVHIIGEGVLPLKNLTRKQRKELFPYGNPLKTPLEKFFGERDTYAVINYVDGRNLVIFYPVVIWSDLNRDKKTILSYARRIQRTPQSESKISRLKAKILEFITGEGYVRKESNMPKLSDDQTEFFRITKRFLNYIEKAPIDRITKFLDRFGQIRAGKTSLRNLVHEGAHIQQDSEKKRHPLLAQSWFVEILYFLARFSKTAENYLEKKAEEEEERVRKKPKWFDVVDFKINQPLNPPAETELPKAA